MRESDMEQEEGCVGEKGELALDLSVKDDARKIRPSMQIRSLRYWF